MTKIVSFRDKTDLQIMMNTKVNDSVRDILSMSFNTLSHLLYGIRDDEVIDRFVASTIQDIPGIVRQHGLVEPYWNYLIYHMLRLGFFVEYNNIGQPKGLAKQRDKFLALFSKSLPSEGWVAKLGNETKED